jgi:colicin import membrane protein
MPPRHLKTVRGPILPPRQVMNLRALGLALLTHLILVLMLVLGLDWKTESNGPLQVMLVAEGNSPVSPPPQIKPPEPTPKPEPAPEPKPEPPPEPSPPPPPPPPPPVAPAAAPTPQVDPEIALEQEAKRRREQERLEREIAAKDAADKRAAEEAIKEKERIKKELEIAKIKETERLEQRRRDAERAEADKKAKEETAKKLVAEKLAAEKKEKEEAEKKTKEETAKKAKEDAAKVAAAEKKVKEEAAQRAAKDQALKDMMRGDALSAAGLPGGTADRNQSGGGRDDGYGAKVRACVLPGVSFPPPPRGAAGNPAAQYRVSLKPDGQIADVKLTKSSGNMNFDRAVETGIRRCTPFPRPSSGSYPGYIDVNYNMYD